MKFDQQKRSVAFIKNMESCTIHSFKNIIFFKIFLYFTKLYSISKDEVDTKKQKINYLKSIIIKITPLDRQNLYFVDEHREL